MSLVLNSRALISREANRNSCKVNTTLLLEMTQGAFITAGAFNRINTVWLFFTELCGLVGCVVVLRPW